MRESIELTRRGGTKVTFRTDITGLDIKSEGTELIGINCSELEKLRRFLGPAKERRVLGERRKNG